MFFQLFSKNSTLTSVFCTVQILFYGVYIKNINKGLLHV
jgi:hypothetical protein